MLNIDIQLYRAHEYMYVFEKHNMGIILYEEVLICTAEALCPPDRK